MRSGLVADLEEHSARLVDPLRGTTLKNTQLPGRPRWCVFDSARDRFLINVREPACVVALDAGTGVIRAQITVSGAGPHGLDLDASGERAFVACDAGVVVLLDLTQDPEIASR